MQSVGVCAAFCHQLFRMALPMVHSGEAPPKSFSVDRACVVTDTSACFAGTWLTSTFTGG